MLLEQPLHIELFKLLLFRLTLLDLDVSDVQVLQQVLKLAGCFVLDWALLRCQLDLLGRRRKRRALPLVLCVF